MKVYRDGMDPTPDGYFGSTFPGSEAELTDELIDHFDLRESLTRFALVLAKQSGYAGVEIRSIGFSYLLPSADVRQRRRASR